MRAYIRIVQTPVGEAPLWVREEWVGLELPLLHHEPVTTVTSGVLSGPQIRNWIDYFKGMLAGRIQKMTGYVVSVDEAVAILEQANPAAAHWWRKNTPHMFGQDFIFDAPACEVIDRPAGLRGDPANDT